MPIQRTSKITRRSIGLDDLGYQRCRFLADEAMLSMASMIRMLILKEYQRRMTPDKHLLNETPADPKMFGDGGFSQRI